jgi:hypothetical protein
MKLEWITFSWRNNHNNEGGGFPCGSLCLYLQTRLDGRLGTNGQPVGIVCVIPHGLGRIDQILDSTPNFILYATISIWHPKRRPLRLTKAALRTRLRSRSRLWYVVLHYAHHADTNSHRFSQTHSRPASALSLLNALAYVHDLENETNPI